MTSTLCQPRASIVEANQAALQPFRALFLQELNRQFRYDACHRRGWADAYLLKLDDTAVGYAAIKGQAVADRDTVFEFYVVPPFRRWSEPLFAALQRRSAARFIECQSNDMLLSTLLHALACSVRADVVLFEDHVATQQRLPGAVVRPRRDGDQVFEHTLEPIGDYVLEVDGSIVATGGFARHYNPPFADLYMEVRPDARQQGYGSFLVQELKRTCYLAGHVPAARCRVENQPSRATLTRAGLRTCGFMLIGDIAHRPG